MAAMYTVRFINDHGLDVTIDIPGEQYILSSAQEHNVNLPNLCQAGACSTCAGKLIEGDVDQSDQVFLDSDQIDAGFVLICVAYARADCTIRTHQADSLQ